MARPTPGIGRGLDAILRSPVQSAAALGEELRSVPLEMVVPNRRQPRRQFDEESLEALAGSLGERGVLQPVLVRPRADGTYELIAGERRWRAARLAGLETIPALVRPGADAEALELALIENMAREDLNPIEEAQACAALMDELGLTQEDVGRRVGRARASVSNLVRLLELPQEAIEYIQSGVLSEGHGRALLMAGDHGARRLLARKAVHEGWSVRATEARAREGDGDTAARRARRRAASSREMHPDQEHAAAELAEALCTALGAEVRVSPRHDGSYRAEITIATRQEGLDLAERVTSRALA